MEESSDEFKEIARFDASQYAFFGDDVVEEVELGGLEEEDGGGGDIGFIGINDDDCQGYRIEFNKGTNEPSISGATGGRRTISRESSSTGDRFHDLDFSNILDQHVLDPANSQDGKRWWSQPHSSSPHFPDSRSLHRTCSYPEQLKHQVIPSESMPMRRLLNSSFTSPGGISNIYPNQSSLRRSSSAAGFQMPFSMANLSQFSQFHLSTLPHGYNGNMSQFITPHLPVNNIHQNNWTSPFAGEHALLSNMVPHQLPHLHGPLPPQMQRKQHQGFHQFDPALSQLSKMQPQLFNHQRPLPHMMYNFGPCVPELRDPRIRPHYGGRLNNSSSEYDFDSGIQKSKNGWSQFRSKYMTTEDIESIMRMQHAATHSIDPYLDDYYHQACLAKKFAGHRFCPNKIKDQPVRGHAEDEPHRYLQVDALGRLPLSSIRRPRPLLEVDPASALEKGMLDQKSFVKPLEQEPMLAARITIEDGFALISDVDDVDRAIEFHQPQDGGCQLRKKRGVILEELAASLQLVDPLEAGKDGKSGLDTNADLVFLRLVSLPKGRKFLSRFLQLLVPGSDLSRIVCMAIFRHLRFLFGELPLDIIAAKTTTNLANIVSLCVRGMDLNSLSVCLAAVACSPEQPPLRPLGSSAGDGATVVIKSILERATERLTDSQIASKYSLYNRNLWQASFDAFFELVTRYCQSKYDSVMQSFLVHAQDAAIIGTEAARAIGKEMPVELLRASLPHTNESQRKLLFDFAQRSMPIVDNASGDSNRSIAAQSVRANICLRDDRTHDEKCGGRPVQQITFEP